MISLRDSYTIARTKLKTRKIRTGLTIGVSGILFGLLVASSLLISGVQRSVDTFSKEGIGARYIAMAMMPPEHSDYSSWETSPEVIARAEQIQQQRIKDKQADAKKLGIEYDPRTEQSPVTTEDGVKYLQYGTKAAEQAIDEFNAKNTNKKAPYQIVKEEMKSYDVKTIYTSDSLLTSTGTWRIMKDGKEELGDVKMKPENYDIFSEKGDPLANGVLVMDKTLTESFLTKKQVWKPEHKTIPVIITYAQAEKYLGLKRLPAGAKPDDKLERIKKIREEIPGYRIESCYRNGASLQGIQDTIQQTKEIKVNATNKEYIQPAKQTKLPDPTSCGAPIVTKDTRTASEKKIEAGELTLAKKYDGVVDPVQEKYTFEVVGLSPGVSAIGGSLAGDIVQSIFNPTLGTSWIIPRDKYEQIASSVPVMQTINSQEPEDGIASLLESHYVEFSSYKDAVAAIKKYSCAFGCDSNQALYLATFGSGSIALQQIKESIYEILKYALVFIVVVASIIMMGTIGRTIADSRRETAVFRAIGAKRSDVSLIYFVYSILLSIRVIIFAIVLSLVIVLVIDNAFSKEASVNAQLLFGTSDLTRTFHFIGLNSMEIVAVAGIICVCALVSAVVPLLRAIRRSPINDMRDDT